MKMIRLTFRDSLKPLLFSLLLAFASGIAMGQKVLFQEKVYFKSDKYELNAESKKALAHIKDSLTLDNSCILVVNGHADNEGDPEYNMKLSSKRAESVKKYLIDKGMPAAFITVNFFGETQPVAENSTKEGKQKNRRTEISLNKPVKAEIPVITSTMKDFYGLTALKAETFCVNPERDTLLKCAKGTLVYVKANSFNISEPKAGTCVNLEVKEVFTKSDMVLNDLSSTSNGEMLASQAMVYTNATWNGNKTELVAGKKMVIILPSDTLETVKLFDGERSGNENIMNWTSAGEENLKSFTGLQLKGCWNCLQQAPPACDHCKFFFCRVGRIGVAFKGLGNKEQHIANVEFRACQKRLKTWKNNPCSESWATCNPLYELFYLHDVNKIEDLKIAANEANSRGTKLSLEKMKYYIFNVSKLGWINAASFNPKNNLVNMEVKLVPGSEVDCKLVFKNLASVAPGSRTEKSFVFNNVPKGEAAWVVAIKYANDKSYFYMREVSIDVTPIEISFQPMSIEDIKKELLKLNMNVDMRSAQK